MLLAKLYPAPNNRHFTSFLHVIKEALGLLARTSYGSLIEALSGLTRGPNPVTPEQGT